MIYNTTKSEFQFKRMSCVIISPNIVTPHYVFVTP